VHTGTAPTLIRVKRERALWAKSCRLREGLHDGGFSWLSTINTATNFDSRHPSATAVRQLKVGSAELTYS